MRLPLTLLVLCAAGAVSAEPRPAYLPGATAAGRPAPGFQLRREPGKGWVYEHAGFVARVAEDGSVRFDDRHGDIHLVLPVPLPMPEGTPTLEGSLRKLVNPHARPRPPSPELPQPVPRMSPYRPDPTEWCVYPNACFFTARIMLVTVSGTFDLNDEILRLSHKDPYRNQKAAFLASTLAFRQELGKRAASRAQAQALDELRRRIEAIEGDRQLDPAARRAALRALADELDPDPSVAAPARALIDAHLQGK